MSAVRLARSHASSSRQQARWGSWVIATASPANKAASAPASASGARPLQEVTFSTAASERRRAGVHGAAVPASARAERLQKVTAAGRELAGTPFAPWLAIRRASIHFVRRDGAVQLDIASASPSLAARAEWLHGLSAGVSGSPFDSRTHLLSAAV